LETIKCRTWLPFPIGNRFGSGRSGDMKEHRLVPSGETEADRNGAVGVVNDFDRARAASMAIQRNPNANSMIEAS
jgi:hypothetical protein